MSAENWPELRDLAQGRPAIISRRKSLDDDTRVWSLADLRKNRDLSQKQVAAYMGVQQSRISHLENGDVHNVQIATLNAFIAALGGRLTVLAEFGERQMVIADGKSNKPDAPSPC